MAIMEPTQHTQIVIQERHLTNELYGSEAAQRRQGLVASGALFLRRAASPNMCVRASAQSEPPDLSKGVASGHVVEPPLAASPPEFATDAGFATCHSDTPGGADGNNPRGATSTEANGTSLVEHTAEPWRSTEERKVQAGCPKVTGRAVQRSRDLAGSNCRKVAWRE